MTCGEKDKDITPNRLHQSPTPRPTISHTPSFSTSSSDHSREKDNRKSFTQRCVSPDLPKFRAHPSSPIALEEYELLPASIQ